MHIYSALGFVVLRLLVLTGTAVLFRRHSGAHAFNSARQQ